MASSGILLRGEKHGSNYAGRNQTTFSDIRGGIKSVQRGVISKHIQSNNRESLTVEISVINPDKSFALVTGVFDSGYRGFPVCYVSEISETSLSILAGPVGTGSTNITAADVTFGWQVIEFK